MKNIIFLFLLLALFGCTYSGQRLSDYMEDPKTIITDPHFTKYKQERDNLESEYLQKKISYAEYVERRDKLDEKYDKEVQSRDSKF